MAVAAAPAAVPTIRAVKIMRGKMKPHPKARLGVCMQALRRAAVEIMPLPPESTLNIKDRRGPSSGWTYDSIFSRKTSRYSRLLSPVLVIVSLACGSLMGGVGTRPKKWVAMMMMTMMMMI